MGRLSEEGSSSDQIFDAVLSEARRERVGYGLEPDTLDRADFMDYVSTCKANLSYADLAAANLPPQALNFASQALQPENLPWYLDLYQRFERKRQELSLITFDDMLLSAWEILMRYEDIVTELRGFISLFWSMSFKM
ncbi:MAG: hypothetical protein R2865_15240 [Deinococcales bacterium]